MARRKLETGTGLTTTRRHVPHTPISDIYYHLVAARWRTLLLWLAVAFVAVNSLFALMYLAAPRSIAGAHGESFADAFFLSVQTMSTIGYGTLAPRTNYAGVVATIEAFVGILCVALVTGLIFAKFGRPRTKVLFTHNMLWTVYDGRPTLLFRVANARGNELVEASIRICVLKPQTTVEGQSMRRLHDLRLERASTPLFRLSWTVMHTIDGDSPLHGETPESMVEGGMIVVVSMTGIDGTFDQSVHARHVYQPQDIVSGPNRFADVLDRDEDGTIVVDYDRFDQIEVIPGLAQDGDDSAPTQTELSAEIEAEIDEEEAEQAEEDASGPSIEVAADRVAAAGPTG